MSLDLAGFYAYVEENGSLRTEMHAKRWTDAILRTLGLNIDRSVKKELTQAIPAELGSSLNGTFWLAHFRDTNMGHLEFQNAVARRAGNSDKVFAGYPVKAVFGALKRMVNGNVADNVAESLSPELRAIWQSA